MKNKILKLSLILVFFTSSTSFFAQEIEVKNGEKADSGERDYFTAISRTEEGVFMLQERYRMKRGQYFFEFFDRDMYLVSENDIEFPDKDFNFLQMKVINNRIIVFLSKYDKSNNLNLIYGTTISKEGKFENEPLMIAQFEGKNSRHQYLYDVGLSTDSTQFLIEVTPPVSEKEQMAKRQFIVVDLGFNEVNNEKVDFPYKEDDFSVDQKLLDSKGNIHMICSVKINKKRGSIFSGSSYDKEIHLFTLYKGENEIHEYPIGSLSNDGEFVNQIELKTDKLGRIQCTGFYSDVIGNSASGVFVLTINTNNKELSDVRTQSFSNEFINKFLSRKEKKKKERKKKKDKVDNPYMRLHDFLIRDIVMKDGGGFYLVTEYYRYYITSRTDQNGSTTTTNHYLFNDLIVINVLEDNSVEWYKKVSKLQHSTNDFGRYSGFVSGLSNDGSLNIIFNDPKVNANTVLPEKPVNLRLKKSLVVIVKFDEDGVATKKPVYGSKDLEMYLIPTGSQRDIKNDFILYLRHAKYFYLSHVMLN